MVTIPVSPGQQVVDAAAAPTTGGVAVNADAFGGAISRAIEGTGAALTAVADQENQILRNKAKTELLTGISEFDLQSVQRIDELKKQGVDSATFVPTVTEDIRDRAEEFINSQPEFLRDEARLRTVQVQARAAKSAVVIANVKLNEELQQSEDTFSNNIENSIRFGDLPPEVGAERIQEFANTLPSNRRDAFIVEATEARRKAEVLKALEEDPEAVIADIQAGEFNDVDSTILEGVVASANRAILKSSSSRDILIGKSQDARRVGDNALSARLLLQANGIENPTTEQLVAAQKQLRIPPGSIHVLTKEQSELAAVPFLEAENVDDLLKAFQQVKITSEQNGVDERQVISDVMDLADVPPTLGILLDIGAIDIVKSKEDSVSLSLGIDSALQVTRDKTLAGKIRKDMGSSDSKKLDKTIREELKSYRIVMEESGASDLEIEDFTQSMKDTAMVAFAQDQNTAGNSSVRSSRSAAKKAVLNLLSVKTVIEVNKTDAYVLDKDVATIVTPDFMKGLRQEVLENPDLTIVNNIPTKDLSKQFLGQVASWVNAGSGIALVNKTDGQPITIDINGVPTPIIFNEHELVVAALKIKDFPKALTSEELQLLSEFDRQKLLKNIREKQREITRKSELLKKYIRNK